MKKIYYPIVLAFVMIFSFWLYFYSSWESILINLVIIILAIYILRKPSQSIIAFLFKKSLIRVIFSTGMNILFGFFVFWLIFLISFDFFIAIISFLVVAVAFTIESLITNATAGAIMLTTEQFEIGDLIESNNIQGVVKKINLNYTEMREFDGVKIIIPNNIVYGSSLTKFTHVQYNFSELEKEVEMMKNKRVYSKYISKMEKIMYSKEKLTRYVKAVEFLGEISPQQLDDSLNKVFDKYEQIFGLRPDYGVVTTVWGRIKVNLYVLTNESEKVLNSMDAYLRDIVYEVYHDKIYNGWDEYKSSQQKFNKTSEVKS